MDWYYVESGERVGPLSDAEFAERVRGGRVGPETLVWQPRMADWQAYRDVAGDQAVQSDVTPGGYICSECGRAFPADEVIQYGERYVCAECKPLFVQRIHEQGGIRPQMRYAGFWIRFVAIFVDQLILFFVNLVVGMVIGVLFAATFFGSEPGSAPPEESLMIALNIASGLVGNIIALAYETYFIGTYGATPGKMVVGIQVLRPNGEKLSYARALGRCFGKWLSGIICAIGYIMAAFDEEKRALHDHICDTRVVYK